jgi:hypothetical protein
MGLTMQNTSTTSSANSTSPLGRIGRDPSRLVTAREWWHEMNAPLDLPEDPEVVFAQDEYHLIKFCRENGIDYRERREGEEAAFPIWMMLLLQFYSFSSKEA